MTVFQFFSDKEIDNIYDVLVDLGFADREYLGVLVCNLRRTTVAHLPTSRYPAVQLREMLQIFNRARTVAGEERPPLLSVFMNAAALTSMRPERKIFNSACETIEAHLASTSPFYRSPIAPSEFPPLFGDPHHKKCAEQLEQLYFNLTELKAKGEDTGHILSLIRKLKYAMRSGPDLVPGSLLADGRFQLLKPVGRGGFGTVWQAYDKQTASIVAIKILHGYHSRDRSRLERFFRGAARMRQLDHWYITKVVQEQGVEDTGDGFVYYYFVMQFLSGGTFEEAVSRRRIDREHALLNLYQVSLALQFAHESRLIHRDLSPDNILLDKCGVPHLSDFDLVRAEDSTGGTSGGIGKQMYSAPEVLSHNPLVDVRADVYSLGMLCLFILYGGDLPQQALHERSKFIRSIRASSAMKNLVTRATAVEPTQRPETAAAFCIELLRAIHLPRPRFRKVLAFTLSGCTMIFPVLAIGYLHRAGTTAKPMLLLSSERRSHEAGSLGGEDMSLTPASFVDLPVVECANAPPQTWSPNVLWCQKIGHVDIQQTTAPSKSRQRGHRLKKIDIGPLPMQFGKPIIEN